jgi:hypothetical protein
VCGCLEEDDVWVVTATFGYRLALDPLAFGVSVSQHSFLLADTTRLLGQSIP